jgi:hypothetical protein
MPWRLEDLSRPAATLPYEGRDQATSVATEQAGSPLLQGEGLGVRSACHHPTKPFNTIDGPTTRHPSLP